MKIHLSCPARELSVCYGDNVTKILLMKNEIDIMGERLLPLCKIDLKKLKTFSGKGKSVDEFLQGDKKLFHLPPYQQAFEMVEDCGEWLSVEEQDSSLRFGLLYNLRIIMYSSPDQVSQCHLLTLY